MPSETFPFENMASCSHEENVPHGDSHEIKRNVCTDPKITSTPRERDSSEILGREDVMVSTRNLHEQDGTLERSLRPRKQVDYTDKFSSCEDTSSVSSDATDDTESEDNENDLSEESPDYTDDERETNSISSTERNQSISLGSQDADPLRCNLCRKTFPTVKAVKKHQKRACPFKDSTCDSIKTGMEFEDNAREVDTSTMLQCHICLKNVMCPKTLARHLKQHSRTRNESGEAAQEPHPQFTLSCSLCSKTFRSRKDLLVHRNASCKGNEVSVKYQCGKCTRFFKSRYYLTVHKKKCYIDTDTDGKRLYSCDRCGSTFSSMKNRTEHKWICKYGGKYTADPDKKTRICPGCSNKFYTDKECFRMHLKRCCMNEKSDKKPCTNASNYETDDKITVNGDTISVDSKVISEWNSRHKCFVCSEILDNFVLWKKHSYAHHLKTYKIYKNRAEYQCPACLKNFNRKKRLEEHILLQRHKNGCTIYSIHIPKESFLMGLLQGNETTIHSSEITHPERVSVNVTDDVSDNSLVQEFFRPGYQCKTCPYSIIRERRNAKRHANRHLTQSSSPSRKKKKKYTASLCELCGMNVGKLKIHLYKKHGVTNGLKQLTCTVCDKVFVDRQKYKTHMLNHKQKFKIECKKCGRILSSKGSLLAHKRSHKEIDSKKEFKCSKCGKICLTSAKLYIHERYHDHVAKRKFECITCGKAFILKHHLASHELVHTKVRKFCCDVWGYAFTLKHHLEFHMERKHGKKKMKQKN